MNRFWKNLGWTEISVFWRLAIVALIVLKAFLVLSRITGVQTDSLNLMSTSATSSQEFAVLYGFLAVLIVLLFSLIAVPFWFKRDQESRSISLVSTYANAPVFRAMETNFRSLSPQDHLARAVALALASSQRDFPVVEDGRLIGMMMQEDLFTALRQAKDQVQVANVMRRELSVVDFNDRLEDALNRLRTSGAHTLPVTNRNRLVGLLTMENAQKFFRIESATRTDPEGGPGTTKFSAENRRRAQPWLHGSNYFSGM